MAFVIEVPSLCDSIDGQSLSLTIGGVKAYNLDNLNTKKGADEHFKIFIGFKVSVCTNLCVWSDGYAGDVRVKNVSGLKAAIQGMISNYSAPEQLGIMESLCKYSLSEQRFAQLIGKCRMYPFLPAADKKKIPQLQLTDSQISMVVRDYYKDTSFSRDEGGEISLWKLYNLLTSATKTTYIDSFLDRNVGTWNFIANVQEAIDFKKENWYLD
jgi:hypothetical protein